MPTAIGCLVAAALLMVLAPWLLARGNWQVARPRLALGAWFTALFTGVALVAAALVGTVLAATSLAVAADSGRAGGGALVTVVAWVSLTGAGAFIGLVSGLSQPLVDSYRRSLRRLSPVATDREDRGAFTLVRFNSEEFLAVAVPGRRPEILLSSALEAHLTPEQLRAVLAHEYAHLRHRHGLAVRIAELNALCLPRWVPAGNALRRATLLLVELAADDVAAGQAGARTLAGALSRIGQATDDPGLELRAARLQAFRSDATQPCGLPLPVRI